MKVLNSHSKGKDNRRGPRVLPSEASHGCVLLQGRATGNLEPQCGRYSDYKLQEYRKALTRTYHAR